MKKIVFMGLLVMSTLGFSQAVTTIPTLTAGELTFAPLYNSGQLQGTLTSVGVNATLSAQTGNTLASDLAILVTSNNTLTGNYLLQVGGNGPLGANEAEGWANGDSSASGTVVNDTYTLITPINFTANPLYSVGIGNANP